MSKIYDNLYLGSAQDAEMMKDADLVINCTPDVPFYATKAHHIRLPVQDNGDPDQPKILYELISSDYIFELIDTYLANDKKVLIHCVAGMQRSAAVAACYVIYKKQCDVFIAISHITKKRPIAFLGSINFMDTIKHYSKSF